LEYEGVLDLTRNRFERPLTEIIPEGDLRTLFGEIGLTISDLTNYSSDLGVPVFAHITNASCSPQTSSDGTNSGVLSFDAYVWFLKRTVQ